MKISDGQLPDYDSGISIMHAWGGERVPGVYYTACTANNITPINYSTAIKNNSENPFDYICEDFIHATNYKPKRIFDFILMDEAQDFSASFYQLCRSIAADDHLIWGYDELQNIFNVKIQNTKEMFKNSYDPKGLDLAKGLR